MRSQAASRPLRTRSDAPFFFSLGALSTSYLLLIAAMLLAMCTFTTPEHLWAATGSPEIRHAIKLSLVSCTLTTILALWIAVPMGYVLSRFRFAGKTLIDTIVDIPIVLPPLVIGLGLLILFQSAAANMIESWLLGIQGALAHVLPASLAPNLTFPVTFAVPAVILAQFVVACAFAVRTMRVTFDQINPRNEKVAQTLGCSRSQAFWLVVLPETRCGMVAAATLAWSRAMGEFGPILVFAGATRMRTEVLPTTVFLELSIGNIEAAVAVSLIMVCAAMLVLIIAKRFGLRRSFL